MSNLAPRLAEQVNRVHDVIRHCCSHVQLQSKSSLASLRDRLQKANIHPKAALYTGLVVITAIWLTAVITRRARMRNDSNRPLTPTNIEKRSPFKAPDRPPGVWPESSFTRPTAPPRTDFSVTDTPPQPYRPFRYGPKYNITMGIRSMDWDRWIELDNEYMRYHTLKKARIEERGMKCCKTAPEAYPAALEFLADLAKYLSERYPDMFRVSDNPPAIHNLVTDETFPLPPGKLSEDPMRTVGRLIQDDVAIMIEKEDGATYLLAGAILLAGFWKLEEKFGMPLSEIHTSGDVPGFKEKLEKPMMNFFRRLQPQSPVVRHNYFIQVDDKLAWSESIGSEDGEEVGWGTAEKDKAIEHHYFRTERQSLRRLPISGGIVFTIRTYFQPVTEVCDEPHVPGRLASAVRSWGDDVSRYKGKERYGDVLLAYLDQRHREQVEAGVVGDEEAESMYPY